MNIEKSIFNKIVKKETKIKIKINKKRKRIKLSKQNLILVKKLTNYYQMKNYYRI